MGMKRRSPAAGLARMKVVRLVGVLLGLVISVGLLLAILLDRAARIEAARRQSMAVTVGVDRLLHLEIRNIERALRGMAVVADGYADDRRDRERWDLSGEIRGVVARHAELQDIDLYGRDGRALYRGVSLSGDDMLPDFDANATASTLHVGPLVHTGRTEPIVPLMLQTPEKNWLVARLRTSELQRMLEDLDVGAQGSVAILSTRGIVLARRGASGAHVGRQVILPVTLSPGSAVQHDVISKLDGVERVASFSSISGYPFVVAAGLAMREALAPWRSQAAIAVSLLVLYWIVTLYLLRESSRLESARDRAHDALSRHADWLAKAQLASQTGVWAMERNSERVQASDHAARLFGFPAVSGPLPLEAFFQRMHESDREQVEMEFARAWDEGRAFHAEYRILLPDGRQRWISAQGAPVHDGDEAPRMTGTVMDITERRHQEEQVERAEAQFRELFELNPLPFWVFDIHSLRFLAVNATAIRRYGYTREEFLAMTILQIRPSHDSAAVRASVDDPAEPRDTDRVWLHRTREGREIHVRIHSSSIRFDGRDARLVLAEDVSDRVAYEADLAWRAAHDEATGLPNVRAFLQALDTVVTEEAHATYAVIHLQIRELDLVASTLGPRARDAIIVEVARRLSSAAGTLRAIAYRPANVFLAAVPGAEWDAAVDALRAVLETPVVSESGSHRIEACIGIAFQQRPDQPAEEVVSHAALAALHARTENAPIMHYTDALAESANRRIATVGKLRSALAGDEFELQFQPIRRVCDGRVVAAEALLRWRSQEGYVSPASFIPLSEESGLIVPIGEWVIDQAARAQSVLSAAGFPEVAVAVNVSAVQFMSASVPRLIRDASARYGLARGALHVELTESAMLRRPDAAKQAMEELQGDGVCVSVDDFGTGFSSMAYLRDLSLDHLKIDRRFVDHVDEDVGNASICRALVALGKGLGLTIIAEGVERAEEYAWLAEHGVDHVQGYFIARPAPLEQFVSCLKEAAGRA